MSALFRVLRPLPGMSLSEALVYGLLRATRRLRAGRLRVLKYHLVAQPVAPAPLLPGRAAAGLQIERIDKDHPRAAELAECSPREPAVIRRRLADGAYCFAAFKDATLSGFLWLQPGPYADDEVRCLFHPQPAGRAAWDFDVWLHPEQRATRLFLRLWDAAFADLRARGVRWTMSRVNAYKSDSLRAHARLGAVIIGTATFYCAGSRQWLHIERCATVQRQPDQAGSPVLCVFPPEGDPQDQGRQP
jgi:hypothetical protein